ncbi:MAG: polysaccharide pyruvyl transferase family protein [Lachnospiraceae bacterium]|nr:polysaccharide pyruvyl transferase family protein [Lachnospiraceae bacterium]
MLRIGIVTLFDDNYNYGGQLQAYAMCRLFGGLKQDAKVVSFHYDSGKYLVQRIKALGVRGTWDSLKNKVIFRWRAGQRDSQLQKEYAVKIEKYQQFMKEIPHTETFAGGDMQAADKQFDCFVCGSDQVWNPGWWNDIYFLGFTEKPKFSYAASIARESLKDRERKYIKRMTKDYLGIAVRESKAKELLSNVTDQEVFVTLDPTLMVEKKVWEELAVLPAIKEKYVLVYKIGSVTEIVKQVYNVCRQAGYLVVSVGYAKNTYRMGEEKIADIMVSSAGPREWIGLIKNAEFVFTDSFHGSVFSVIFHKNFWCFEKEKSSVTNENSRLYSLLQSFDLTDRLLAEEVPAFVFDKKINYAAVMELYAAEKRASFAYINSCLEAVERSAECGYE